LVTGSAIVSIIDILKFRGHSFRYSPLSSSFSYIFRAITERLSLSLLKKGTFHKIAERLTTLFTNDIIGQEHCLYLCNFSTKLFCLAGMTAKSYPRSSGLTKKSFTRTFNSCEAFSKITNLDPQNSQNPPGCCLPRPYPNTAHILGCEQKRHGGR